MLTGSPIRESRGSAIDLWKQAVLELEQARELLRVAENKERETRYLAQVDSIEGISLTRREFEVLGLIRQKLQNKEIADKLGISLRTVKWWVSSILCKLDKRSRHDL